MLCYIYVLLLSAAADMASHARTGRRQAGRWCTRPYLPSVPSVTCQLVFHVMYVKPSVLLVIAACTGAACTGAACTGAACTGAACTSIACTGAACTGAADAACGITATTSFNFVTFLNYKPSTTFHNLPQPSTTFTSICISRV